MKLLSVALPHHDANLSYFDGQRVHYIKLERTRQEKRFHLASLPPWQEEAQSLWGIAGQDLDDCVFSFDPGDLPPALRQNFGRDAMHQLATDRAKALRLPTAVCEHLGVARGWLISHHYSHALSSWMLENRPPDVQIVIDGLGDGRPWSVYKHGQLVAAGDIRNGSIGWGMREAGKLLGIRHGHYNDIAGKLMGLQSHGRVDPAYLDRLRGLHFGQLKQLWSVEPWLAHRADALVGQLSLLDWAATVHVRMGEMLLAFFQRFAGPDDVIAYSGGVAQNVIWNALLKAEFPHLLIPPHASDEGLSLGALEWLRRQHNLPGLQLPDFPYAQADVTVPAPSDQTLDTAARLLAAGRVVGWYQGHGEIGPRALGNRSILMHPGLPDGKRQLNRVKQRENYRPFGASVLREHFDRYFAGAADEFMLYACQLKTDAFPAITHVDGSCRVQLVGAANPVLRRLLLRFHELTGCPLLLNTSLNLAGKPLAAFPANAEHLFQDSAIDAVVVGDRVLSRLS